MEHYLSLIICIIGGVIYAVCSMAANGPAWLAELGRLSFWVGLLAFLLGR